MPQTLSTAELRRQNRNRIYQFLYHSTGPVTKQMISEGLSLSLPTITQNFVWFEPIDKSYTATFVDYRISGGRNVGESEPHEAPFFRSFSRASRRSGYLEPSSV